MDSYFFILTTIDLFVLGFMSLLTKLSESLNKKQKRGFLLAFALIACISVLEVITIVVDGAPTGCRWLNILSNYLGFGLTPAVALCLVYVLDKKSIIRRGFKAAVCCEGAYLLFLAATLPYGLVFSVSRRTSTPGENTSIFMWRCTMPPCCTLWWLRCARQRLFRTAAAR